MGEVPLDPILPPRAAVGAADGLSFIPGNQLFRAINDATGHIEKLSTIMGNLVEEAGGE